MTGWISRLRARQAQITDDDSGFTMIEIVVVMVIMTVVLIIFTSGITQAFSAENKNDTSASAEGQLVIAFQRLDTEVRYASQISDPGTQSGDPVVEFLSPDLTNPTNNTCTEVRLHTPTGQLTGQLQQRTWTQGAVGTTPTPTGWQQLASSVIAGTLKATASAGTASTSSVVVVAPFATIGPNPTQQFQRLEVAVNVTFGGNQNATTKQSDITFTSINSTSSSTGSTTTTVCNEGRGVAW
jgi:prepilin-type N-terminal cleavage/methylation domain-containing protein